MSSKVKSIVWNYFIRTEIGGKCKMCQNEVKTGGNTTNLKNHLKRKHNETLTELNEIENNTKQQKIQCENDNINEYEDNTLPVINAVSSPTTSTVSQSCSISPCPTISVSSVCEIGKKRVKKCVQPQIDKTIYNMKTFEEGGAKNGQITNGILYMIAKDNLPFNTVEKEGFQYFMKTTVPLYKVPGRKKITTLIEEKYELLSNVMKIKLSAVEYLCLTTDVWTDTLNTRSYLGMAAHFVLNEKLTSIVIGVTELSERHTSDYLGQWLSSICTEWHIKMDNVVAVVTDNAANIVKAVNDIFGKNKHLPCFAHTLNLVATTLLKENREIEAFCDKVKALVTFFKQSVIAADELRKYEQKKLIQCVPTRWNSVYYMLERFIELSEGISLVLLKFPKAPPMLSASELQLAREIIQVLSPIEAATKEICGESYVTGSKVIPLINCLKKKIDNLAADLSSSAAMKLLHSLSTNINIRFGTIEQVNLLAISTLLDPRFKRLHFNNHVACSRSINKISNQMEKLNDFPEKENTQLTENASTSPHNIWSFHEDLANKVQFSHDKSNDMPTDMKHYLNQPTIGLAEDPIYYWYNIYKSIYPSLRVIAKQYLPIVATSVPSERLFSKAGNIMVENRSKLSPKHLQNLLFLNSLSLKKWKINE